MLEFKKINGAYIALGNNETEYTIELIDSDVNLYDTYKKCVVTLRNYGFDNIEIGSMRFKNLKIAKDWANKDNDYLALYL